MQLTRHLITRSSQRGISIEDLEAIIQFGSDCGDGYMMMDRDVSDAVSELKAEIKRFERLAGAFVAINDDNLLTAYQVNKKKSKNKRQQIRSGFSKVNLRR